MKSASMRDQERICDMLKREAMQLAKLRHPSCLQVVESVDESRTAIAFATEPVCLYLPSDACVILLIHTAFDGHACKVFASLSNILGDRTNLDKPPDTLKEYALDELEVMPP